MFVNRGHFAFVLRQIWNELLFGFFKKLFAALPSPGPGVLQRGSVASLYDNHTARDLRAEPRLEAVLHFLLGDRHLFADQFFHQDLGANYVFFPFTQCLADTLQYTLGEFSFRKWIFSKAGEVLAEAIRDFV